MKQVNVGILGATGAVGQEMIKILEERNFPVASLRPIASARSAAHHFLAVFIEVPFLSSNWLPFYPAKMDGIWPN